MKSPFKKFVCCLYQWGLIGPHCAMRLIRMAGAQQA